MKTKSSIPTRSFLRLFAVSALLATTTACPASSDDDPNADETDSGNDDGSDYVCDPMGENPDVGELLNAPLEDDVEVIIKEPQHPGDPGPDNLPE